MSSRDLDRLYELLGELEKAPEQGRKLADYSGRTGWPTRGVYFFREQGENRRDSPQTARIVRVGTHAVSANSKSALWGRLRSHRGNRAGGGNHRGSIFRLHVGDALLRRDNAFIGELSTWSVGSTASNVVRLAEAEHEQRVSAYLGRMSLLWVEVPDEPGPNSDRGYIERNSIALLSNTLRPLAPPSQSWLGLHSPRMEIRSSGLWNLNHVQQQYTPEFLSVLERYILRHSSSQIASK